MGWMRKVLDAITYSGYEGGYAKYLIGREPDKEVCQINGMRQEDVDAVLRVICESFDIVEEQRFCLRPEDNLGDIYRSFHGPLDCCDDFEFERLWWELERLSGRILTQQECESIHRVRDVIEFVLAEKAQQTATTNV